MPAKKDLTGMKFGKLTVVYEAERTASGRIAWHCKCDCGNEKDIPTTSLTKTKNPTLSCGCL